MSTLTRITLGRLQRPLSAGVAVGLVEVALASSTLLAEVVETLSVSIDSTQTASITGETLSAAVATSLVADLTPTLTGEVN